MLSPDEIKNFKSLQRRANDRLRALEKLQKQAGYENVTKYAYKAAMRDIKTQGGKSRFTSVNAKTSRKEYEKKMNELDRFLSAPTSTKSGITKIYKQRAEEFTERTGAKVSWQDLAALYETGIADMLASSGFGSDVVQMMFATIKANKDSIKEQIAKGKAITVTGEYSEVLNQELNKHIELLERYVNTTI